MKNKVFLSWFCAGAILLVVLVGTLSIGYAKQEAYPARDIVWIVPFSPGGGYDTYARGIIPYLEKYLPRKVNVVVKNIRGAGGVTGVSHLYKSKPNGYTIGYAAYPGMAVVKMTMDVGFDPGKLTPLAKIAVSPQALFVAGNSPLKSLKDLKKKGKIKLGTTPKGASMYTFCAVANAILGLNAQLVTGYGGTADVVPAIMRGDVHGGALNLTQLKKYIESGDLKPVATFTSKRHELTPKVPSVAELGYAEATVVKDYKMLFAPPGLPKEVATILRTAIVNAMKDKDLLAWSKKTNMPLELAVGKGMTDELERIEKVYRKYVGLLK